MLSHRIKLGPGRGVVRAQALDDAPEARRVIHLPQMRQLVRHYVIDDMRRRLHEPPAQTHVALGVAAPPPSLGIGDENARWLDRQLAAVVLDASAEVSLGVASVPLHQSGAHRIGRMRLGQLQRQNVAIPELRQRVVLRNQNQPQLPAQVVDQLAVLPQTRSRLARFPALKLAQHPGRRVLQKTRDVTIGRTPRDADGETALVDREDGASTLESALEQEIDVALT